MLLSHLVRKEMDTRKEKRKVALFTPLGDLKFWSQFVKSLKEQTFNDYDLIIVKRNDLAIPLEDLPSEVQVVVLEERCPLGVSVAFFVGSLYAYLERYKYLFIADVDAVMLSRDFLERALKTCEGQGICIPRRLSKENLTFNDLVVGNINQFGCICTDIFESVGFYNPFFLGACEDLDIIFRLKEKALFKINTALVVDHPLNNQTVFERVVYRNKHLSYVLGCWRMYLARALDVGSIIKKIYFFVRAVLLLSYNIFHSVVFYKSDFLTFIKALFTLKKPPRFESGDDLIEIERVRERAHFSHSPVQKVLISNILLASNLLFGRPFTFYLYRVNVKRKARTLFLFLLAILLIPFILLFSFFVSIYTLYILGKYRRVNIGNLRFYVDSLIRILR